MIVTFDISKKDYEKFSVYSLQVNKTYRIIIWLIRSIFCLGLLGGLMKVIQGDMELTYFLEIAVFCIILVEFLIPLRFKSRIKYRRNKIYKTLEPLFKNVQVTLSYGGIVQSGCNDKESFHKYADVSGIVCNVDCYYILMGKNNCIIPFSAFADVDERTAFMTMLKEKTGKEIKKALKIVI